MKGLELFKLYRKEYASVYIFKKLTTILQELHKITHIRMISAALNDDENKLETLMDRPHVQILERILKFQKIMYKVKELVVISYNMQAANLEIISSKQ